MKDRWVQRFIDGEQDAIATFYEIEHPKIVFFVYSYVFDKELAADISSKLFEKLLEMPANNRGKLLPTTEDEFRKYVYTMAKNAVIDSARKQKSKDKYHLENQGTSSAVDDNVQAFIAREIYEKSIQKLGSKQREIFELHLNGFSNQEIAQKLSISNNTVKNTLVNARKKLRVFWNKYF